MGGMSAAGMSGGAEAAGGAAAGTGGALPMGDGGFTINVGLASDEKATAPTTVGIVTWSLDKTGLTEAHIDFGLDTGYGMTAPVDLQEADYRTLLLGMKPDSTYHFRVVATDGSQSYTSDDQTVTTGPDNSSINISNFTVRDAAQVEKGFMVSSFWQGSGSTVPFIMDSDGDIVWWYTRASSESNDGVSRARMSADSKNIWLANETLSGAPLRRISMDTLDVQTYNNATCSHDIAAVSGDTMAYLDYGESGCNSIFEINNAGDIKEIFEADGVVSNSGGLLGCHANSVRYSMAEDVYVYSDWQSDVFVVDRSGAVQWKLSDKVSGGNSSWGGAQHGTQLLDNSLLIFANSGAGNGSAAIEFGLDGSVMRTFNSAGSTMNFGDVQRLPNGNTLIDYANASVVQEVNANDEVVLEFRASGSFGYIEFRQSLYGLPLDIQQ